MSPATEVDAGAADVAMDDAAIAVASGVAIVVASSIASVVMDGAAIAVADASIMLPPIGNPSALLQIQYMSANCFCY